MSEQIRQIASRIKELREICGFSQQEMAQKLSLDLDLYKSYEDSGLDIPISVIFEIANLCKVDFNEILSGVSPKLSDLCLVRRGDGLNMDRFPGYHFESLAHKFVGKIMEPLLVTVEPKEGKPELVTHPGQEYNLVLEGSILLVYDGREIILNPGDSVYFSPLKPHSQAAVGDKKARFLTVIAQ